MKLLSWWRRKSPKPTPEPAATQRKLSYQCGSIQGIGEREYQEDALALVNADDVTKIRQEGLLAMVADGMGGLEHGALASTAGIQTITQDFLSMDRTQPLEPQLTQSLLHAAQVVYDMLRGNGGSTMIACILFDEQLYYAGAGDSFLYLLRQGKLIRINREQNVGHRRYLELIRRGQMDVCATEGIHQAHAVTNFLGIDRMKEMDCLCSALPLMDDDVLLLCSDGVGGVLSPQEICACLSVPNANEAALALQSRIVAKNEPHQDNFTAVVIRCKK